MSDGPRRHAREAAPQSVTGEGATAPPVAWSVVVPTFDRPAALLACVEALAALDPPPGGYEIVVVNDGGTDPPAAVRAAAMDGNAAATSFLSTVNRGPAAARNLGAAHAHGRWLAFTDDDCVPSRGWLRALDAALAPAPDALVGGPVLNGLPANLFAEASQRLAEHTRAHFDGARHPERFFTTNNIALARSGLLAAGGFDTRFRRGAGEDRELCDRWHAQGRRSVLEPRAVVHHSHHLDLWSFLRQHRDYGRAATSFRAVRRAAGRAVRIEPGFYLGSLRRAWQGVALHRGAALAVLTLVAHAAYLGGLTVNRLGRG